MRRSIKHNHSISLKDICAKSSYNYPDRNNLSSDKKERFRPNNPLVPESLQSGTNAVPEEVNTPDWDIDDAWRTRLFREIKNAKEERRKEFVLNNKEKELLVYQQRNLELEKKQLEYDRHSVEARLQVDKYRDILPYLRDDMSVDFHEIVIWIELIRDKAATEGIDAKSAVTLIVQDLKLYNQFNSLKRSVEPAQQDLESLNIVVEQRKQAIASLVDLKNRGISDTDLVEQPG